MGIHQMVSGFTQTIRKNNTTNARLGRDVLRRATSIAADLERSEKVEDKSKLELVTKILEQTSDHFKLDPRTDDLPQRIDLAAHWDRKIALIAADAELDKIQPSSDDRGEVLRKLAEKDAENYKAELKALCDGAEGSIRQVLRILPTKTSMQDPMVREKLKKVMIEEPAFKNLWEVSSSVWEVMGEMVESKIIDEEIIVHITNLDKPFERTITHRAEPHQTLAELSEIAFANDDPDEPFPDHYVKKLDPEKNQCTKSGHWWQHQPPEIRVCDALTADGHGIRRLDIVKRNGAYVIALVNDNGNENGTPLDLPKGREQKPVSEHMQSHFRDRKIIKIMSLDGKDIAQKPWSKRTFLPYSNPLYIELGEQMKQAVRVHTA